LDKKARKQVDSTGFGITDQNRKDNITTTEMLKDSLCPFYSRMDALYGERQNINPTSIMDSGMRYGGEESDEEEEADVPPAEEEPVAVVRDGPVVLDDDLVVIENDDNDANVTRTQTAPKRKVL
jgi:hypothetical protein